MSEMKTTFIKKTIINKSIGQRVEFGFDAPIDWIPGKGACWVNCPFSVCTSLDNECRALVNNLCPFTKNMETFNYDDYGDGTLSLIRDVGTDTVWEMILPTNDTTQKERDFN